MIQSFDFGFIPLGGGPGLSEGPSESELFKLSI